MTTEFEGPPPEFIAEHYEVRRTTSEHRRGGQYDLPPEHPLRRLFDIGTFDVVQTETVTGLTQGLKDGHRVLAEPVHMMRLIKRHELRQVGNASALNLTRENAERFLPGSIQLREIAERWGDGDWLVLQMAQYPGDRPLHEETIAGIRAAALPHPDDAARVADLTDLLLPSVRADADAYFELSLQQATERLAAQS